MTIAKQRDGSTLTIAPVGRLDTTAAPDLEKIVRGELGGVSELILDCQGLEYISSAGLRVLLMAKKALGRKGVVKLTHVNDGVMDVLQATGFSNVLTIVK